MPIDSNVLAATYMNKPRNRIKLWIQFNFHGNITAFERWRVNDALNVREASGVFVVLNVSGTPAVFLSCWEYHVSQSRRIKHATQDTPCRRDKSLTYKDILNVCHIQWIAGQAWAFSTFPCSASFPIMSLYFLVIVSWLCLAFLTLYFTAFWTKISTLFCQWTSTQIIVFFSPCSFNLSLRLYSISWWLLSPSV